MSFIIIPNLRVISNTTSTATGFTYNSSPVVKEDFETGWTDPPVALGWQIDENTELFFLDDFSDWPT